MLIAVGDTAAVSTVSRDPAAVSVNADQDGTTTASSSSPRLSRSTAVSVIWVDWPLAYSSAVAAEQRVVAFGPCRVGHAPATPSPTIAGSTIESNCSAVTWPDASAASRRVVSLAMASSAMCAAFW